MDLMNNQNNQNSSVTIGDLARMVQKGFEETAKKEEVNMRFNQADHRFNRIDDRLETIEKLLIKGHRIRIEKIEEDIKELKSLLVIG
ncbi:hypothetical protein KKC65_02705 [Patescibacteria group bacterium]|nr:hypothetical protein [Patescibacteria group bacterium]